MRTYSSLIILTFLLSISTAAGQTILNSGFETWVSTPQGWEDPENWTSSNATILGGDSAVYESTDAYSGIFAAELLTLNLGFVGLPYPGYLVNGAYSGDWLSYGTPITFTPKSLSGYYKYTSGAPDDSAHIVVILKKYNASTNSRDTIGLTVMKLGFVASFQKFTVSIDELVPGTNPDSVLIAFFSSDPENAYTDMYSGGRLSIDELTLDTITSIETTSLDQVFEIHPNPTTGRAYLTNLQNAPASVLIYNILGELVQALDINLLNPVVDLSEFPKGVYLIQVEAEGEIITKKLVKQ
ncbi:T9SS type A sorting domain-containing protein [Flavobacteriales bacterium AH-315-E23]|nr:T9SS type A sorting domain-containing protein [Flavobacteriales bacterium AH-315-E23]